MTALGRGRGRGRAISTQPLRRPAMPAVAVEEQKKDDPQQSSQNESPWSGSLSVGRGRGVRPPNTAPTGWAGPSSAPDPSTAPLPPTAWQQDRGMSWEPTNTNVARMPFSAWPSLGASSNQAGAKLFNDFERFSLFDKDEYDN